MSLIDADTHKELIKLLNDKTWGNSDINIINGQIEASNDFPGDDVLFDLKCSIDSILSTYDNKYIKELIEDIKEECESFEEEHKEELNDKYAKCYKIMQKILSTLKINTNE